MNPSSTRAAPESRYQSFEEFWPFYLSQHSNAVCRNLHVVGTTLGVAWMVYCLITGQYWKIIFSFVLGYGFSWVGHFIFEKNRPATFTYPKWSFRGDLRMLKLFFTGRLGSEVTKYCR